MYTFPGESFNVRVQFKAGEDPASPDLAAYEVHDMSGLVQSSTPIDVTQDATEVWITVPQSVHTLGTDEYFKHLRITVTYTTNGLTFKQYYSYYVVPDLFLNFNDKLAYASLGVVAEDAVNVSFDYYRAYIDLITGALGERFAEALFGDDLTMQNNARQLIFYQTLLTVFPQVRIGMLKSIQSETSRVERMSSERSFSTVERFIKDNYDLYYSLIRASGTPTNMTFLVLDTPTDAITGVS